LTSGAAGLMNLLMNNEKLERIVAKKIEAEVDRLWLKMVGALEDKVDVLTKLIIAELARTLEKKSETK
jgi:hypothetical protein